LIIYYIQYITYIENVSVEWVSVSVNKYFCSMFIHNLEYLQNVATDCISPTTKYIHTSYTRQTTGHGKSSLSLKVTDIILEIPHITAEMFRIIYAS